MRHPSLIEPAHRGAVDLFIDVKARNPRGVELWAIIHSHKDGGYWAVKLDANNTAKVRVGDPGEASAGHHFKLRIIEPAGPIAADVRMTAWPAYVTSSAVYSLRRAGLLTSDPRRAVSP